MSKRGFFSVVAILTLLSIQAISATYSQLTNKKNDLEAELKTLHLVKQLQSNIAEALRDGNLSTAIKVAEAYGRYFNVDVRLKGDTMEVIVSRGRTSARLVFKVGP